MGIARPDMGEPGERARSIVPLRDQENETLTCFDAALFTLVKGRQHERFLQDGRRGINPVSAIINAGLPFDFALSTTLGTSQGKPMSSFG